MMELIEGELRCVVDDCFSEWLLNVTVCEVCVVDIFQK